ncbi:MAG: hypothetical protein P8179_09140 [Candidatus Thiodiazotropha sp.]
MLCFIPNFFRYLTLLLAMPLLAVAGNDLAEIGDANAPPPLIAQTCFACHGPYGQSLSPAIPSIAGLPKAYLFDVLQAYRHGGRIGTIMDRLTKAYRDNKLNELADYFSRQPYLPHKQTIRWELVDLGRQLHRRYCMDCHGDATHKADEGVPVLYGRWMDYLRWTLRDYFVGINQGDEEMAKQLARLMRSHGQDGLEALIHYYGKAKP